MSGWLWTATATALLVASAAGAAPAGQVAVNLKVVGASDLGRPGIYGDVTVVGTTAVVATGGAPAPGSPCPTSMAQVVDIKDPRQPTVVASIPLPAGMNVALDSLTVMTPVFTGDLLAIALTPSARPGGPCGSGGRVAYYDLTDRVHPELLAETTGAASVSLAQRGDGRVLAAAAGGPGVDVVEVTDPAHPAPVGRWSDPQAGGGGGCAGTARLTDDGEGAVVVRGDGRVYDLDLTDPARPSASGPTEDVGGPARSVHAAVLPLGNRTIAIVSEEGCAEDTAAGERLRVLALERGIAPREEEPVEYPGAGGPGRLVASGALAYVAWHGAGMRVVDFGEVKARTVAQFAPDHADVVGVALLPEHVVVTDASLGLYVLARPDEGGGRAGFWSQFLSLLPYMVLPLMATAFVLVPRLAARGAPATGRVPAPSRRRVA